MIDNNSDYFLKTQCCCAECCGIPGETTMENSAGTAKCPVCGKVTDLFRFKVPYIRNHLIHIEYLKRLLGDKYIPCSAKEFIKIAQEKYWDKK